VPIHRLFPNVKQLVRSRDFPMLGKVLKDWAAPDIADLMINLVASDQIQLLRNLPASLPVEVFQYLPPTAQEHLVKDARRCDGSGHLLQRCLGNIEGRLTVRWRIRLLISQVELSGVLPGPRQSRQPSLTVGATEQLRDFKSVARASARALPRLKDLRDFEGTLGGLRVIIAPIES
jgi:hypothetical protein